MIDEAYVMWVNGQLKGLQDYDPPVAQFSAKTDARYKQLTAALSVYREYLEARHAVTTSLHEAVRKAATPIGEQPFKDVMKRAREL